MGIKHENKKYLLHGKRVQGLKLEKMKYFEILSRLTYKTLYFPLH